MPADLHDSIKESFTVSFRNDYSNIAKEYDFFGKLAPKMQNELVSHLFQDVKLTFKDFFTGCESAFINQFICKLAYNTFESG